MVVYVPSKSLLSAAKAFYHVQTAHYFGAEATSLTLDFSKVMQHVEVHLARQITEDKSLRITKPELRASPWYLKRFAKHFKMFSARLMLVYL
jgi:hypothetical protein